MEEFPEAIQNAGFVGSQFTWARGKTFERLDRILLNREWKLLFQNTTVKYLNRTGSDHAPLLVAIDIIPKPSKTCFRFLNMWTHHDKFFKWVEEAWQYNNQSNAWFTL